MKKLLPLILVLCLLFVACAPAASGGSTSSHMADPPASSDAANTEGFRFYGTEDSSTNVHLHYNGKLLSRFPVSLDQGAIKDGKLYLYNYERAQIFRWDDPEKEPALVASLNTKTPVMGANESFVKVSTAYAEDPSVWNGAVLTNRGNVYWFDGTEFRHLIQLEDPVNDVFRIWAHKDNGTPGQVWVFVDTDETDQLWKEPRTGENPWETQLWFSRKVYKILVESGETIPATEMELGELLGQYIGYSG